MKGFIKRCIILFKSNKYDYIFIHREATPIGPPIFEWLLSKVFQKKIIYDFDDAIWLPNTSDQNKIASRLKWHSKVKYICKWSHKISCGNQYLCNFARQLNENVVLNPTTIDTEGLHNPTLFSLKNSSKLVIGWTGTHSTLPYLNALVPVFQQLENKYDFEFMVISNQAPELPLKSLKFKKWNKETEIEDLLHFDIGVMPLTDDPWTKGKCGFKALQYMALEIPALVSPVGVNPKIIDHGVNGFVCNNHQEWLESLEKLINDSELRKIIGKNGRLKVIENYSVASNQNNFVGLFE